MIEFVTKILFNAILYGIFGTLIYFLRTKYFLKESIKTKRLVTTFVLFFISTALISIAIRYWTYKRLQGIIPDLSFFLKTETNNSYSDAQFRFEHIEYLWMLVAIVPFTLLFAFYRHWGTKSLAKLGKPEMMRELSPERSSGKIWLKFFLLQFAFVFIILGFANPQIGTRQEKVKRQGIDVVVAMDVSNSMMSEDIKPSRLARAKNFVSHFMDELRNDRFGMIVFAGKAYLQMPLTVDYSAGRMYLKTISPRLVPTQGTNIAEAIDLARKSFVKEDTKHKALIIITDGEDNEGGTDEAIEAAVKEGVKIFTIGVGTDNGGPIPVGSDYKREEDGSIVLSKMNPTMLREISEKGKGKYMLLGSGKDEVQTIMKELGRMGTKDFEEYIFTDFDDQYQWCLAIAAILLLIEWMLSERKFYGLKRWA